ncbi:ImpA family type VI secretion system protein [Bradyrhizobium prioriisuperbiae]|uniref:type VI secretion system protein TssA n=1 Tax=Bradyrhizobium prioriisuperbiae TaxID=2854389 RepID=UPI0028F14AB9|nr:type VI secretion system ImpA family N-terminal domain-containing protein [Bradyrhizobium prioritasuperba]
MLDLEALTQPVSGDDPSGPDLDAAGDIQYLNFFAAAEPLLPMSYFDVVNANGVRGRFDPKAVDFDAQFATAQPLLARTRDLRLTILLAKFSILNRDLAGFTKYLKTIAFLIREQWETVHPRSEDGDFSFRLVTVESIDVFPTVINPLQFLPLIENRRFGTVNYRAYQIAKGEIPPSGDETDDLDLATVERIISEADLEALKAISARFAELTAAIAAIKAAWLDKPDAGSAPSFERLSTMAGGIATWLAGLVKDRDPSAIVSAAGTEETGDGEPTLAAANQTVTSTAMAAAALAAAGDYFARSEPSNPSLLLIRQAQEMVGKSFIEVMRMLVPAYVETAAINIGRDKFFDLPIERMATLLTTNGAPADDTETQSIVFSVESRGQTLALLGQVANFFRVSEPSSPIPFLIDRARDMAQRDFLSLLHDVLPEGALKTIDK